MTSRRAILHGLAALPLLLAAGCAGTGDMGSGVVRAVAGVDCPLTAFAAEGSACQKPPPPPRELYCYSTLGEPDCYSYPLPGSVPIEDRAAIDWAAATAAPAPRHR